MTVSVTSNKLSYSGNGSTTEFPTPFFSANTNITAILRTNSTGAEASWVEGTNYTLTGAEAVGGGTLSATVPPASGTTLLIKNVEPLNQDSDFVENDTFPSETFEDALDKLTRICQQVNEHIGRAFVAEETYSGSTAIPDSVTRASKFLSFDSSGVPTVSVGTSPTSTPVTAFMDTVLAAGNAAAARVLLECFGVSELFTEAELTIASGIVTPPDDDTNYSIDTESDAATDDLATIQVTNTAAGQWLVIRSNNTARVVTVKHGTGNIYMSDKQDYELSENSRLVLQQEGSSWYEVSRSNNLYGIRSQAGQIAQHKALVVHKASASTADIDADALIVTDSAGRQLTVESVNLTVDITGSAANGLDTGSEANSTWYYLWVIYNGSTVSGLLSTSISSPTMPSGYTYKGLVGAVYNDSGGAFDDFHQVNNRVATTMTNVLSSGTATSATSVDISTTVPIGATSVLGNARVFGDSSGATGSATVWSNSGGSLGELTFRARNSGVTPEGGPFEQLLQVNQTIYYAVTAGDGISLYVSGYVW